MSEIKLIEGKSVVDDRGTVKFVNDFNFSEVKRFYQVENHKVGFIRAFHGHILESKYCYVVSGSIMVCAAKIDMTCIIHSTFKNLDKSSLQKFFLTSDKPSILYIPSGYANGFVNLTENTKVIFFSTTTLEQSKNDDHRFNWDILGEEIWNTDYYR